jgi:serine/threonine protein kinase
VHAAGFLHRDIKPANLLIGPRGEPTLIDFGASRAAMAGRTVAMTAVFTPGYAAAEQFTAAKQTPATDIYALSATLYHAITGAAPPSAIDRMLDDTCPPLAQLAPPGFRHELLGAIDTGLSVRVSQRPASIADWRSLLEPPEAAAPAATPEQVASSSPKAERDATTIVVKPATNPAPAQPVPPQPADTGGSHRFLKNWGVGIAGAAIALVLAGGIVTSLLLLNSEKDAKQPPPVAAPTTSAVAATAPAPLPTPTLVAPPQTLNDALVCRGALAAGDPPRWESNPTFTDYVAEARRRGQTLESCARLLPRPTSTNTSGSASPPVTTPARAARVVGPTPTSTDLLVCRGALASGNPPRWDTNPTFAGYIAEARRRGQTPESCARLAPP